MENRNGLIVRGTLNRASGTAEREAALELLDAHRPGRRRVTLAGDKAYGVAAFVCDLRQRRVMPRIAIDGHVRVSGKPRKTAIDKRTTRHVGYAISQACRKRIEEAFGWIKIGAGQGKTEFRGVERVRARFILAPAAYNLVRLPKLLAEAPPRIPQCLRLPLQKHRAIDD